MYDVKLQVLHGEYYLTSENQAPVFDKRGLVSLFVQFRIKEDLGQVSVHLTPQTRALSIAMGTMFLTLVWILLFAISMAEKRWLDIEAYGVGIGITFILLLIAK